MKKTIDKSWLAIVRSQQRNPIIVDKVSKVKVGFCDDRSGLNLDRWNVKSVANGGP